MNIKLILSLLMNAAILVATISTVAISFKNPENGTWSWESGKQVFRYFTTLSNLLAALAAAVLIVVELKYLGQAQWTIPYWALVLKCVGTTAVMVTFLTVVFFLGPTNGYKFLFAGAGLYLHLIGPLLAMVSFCMLEATQPLAWTSAFLGLLPTAIYGIVYLILVIVIGKDRGGWEDFYGFNGGGHWKLSIVLMMAGTLVICVLLTLLQHLFA